MTALRGMGFRRIFRAVCLACFLITVLFPARAAWTGMGQPVREEARTLAFSQGTSPTYAFIGLKQYGVYWSQSTDMGLHWALFQPAGLNEFVLQGASVNTVVTSQNFYMDHLVLAGTSDGRVYWSDDVSGSWQGWTAATGLPSPGNKINRIVCTFSAIYACTDFGLYVGDHTGNSVSFSPYSPAVPGTGRVTGLATNMSGNLWVTTYSAGAASGGIYVYEGTGWRTLLDGSGSPPEFYAFNCITISTETTPSFIWAGDDNRHGLLQSIDQGAEWTYRCEDCESVLDIRVAPDYVGGLEHFVYGTRNGWFEGGNTSAGPYCEPRFPKGLTVYQIVPMPFWSSLNPVYMAATSAGLRRVASDFYPQVESNDDMEIFDISTLAPSPNILTDHVVFATSRRYGLFMSRDGGATFRLTQAALEDVSDPSSLPAPVTGVALRSDFGSGGPCGNNAGTMWMATDGLGVFKSVNAGGSWDPFNAGLPVPNRSISALVLTPETSATPMFAGLSDGPGFFKSTTLADDGAWSAVASVPDSTARTLCIAKPPNYGTSFPVLFVGTTAGLYLYDTALDTWLTQWSGHPLPTGTPVRSVVFHPGFNNTGNKLVFAAQSTAGVKKHAYNAGSWEWQTVSSGLGSLYTTALAIDPDYPSYPGAEGRVMAGTYDPNSALGGVYYSMNGGGTWTNVNGTGSTGLSDVHVRSLLMTKPYSGVTRALVGTHKRRLFFSNTASTAEWSAAQGYGSGPNDVRAIAMSAVPRNTLCAPEEGDPLTDFFVSGPEGVFWSNDSGQTYRPLSNWSLGSGICPPTVNALYSFVSAAGCPEEKSSAEAGTPTPVLLAGTQGAGIWYRCATPGNAGGWDWTSGEWKPSNLASQTIHHFVRDRVYGAAVVAAGNSSGADRGAWQSTDGGKTWEALNTGDLPAGNGLRDVRYGQIPGRAYGQPIPEAPGGNTIWGTVNHSGVYQGTQQGLTGGIESTYRWTERNGTGVGTLANLETWSVLQLTQKGSDNVLLTGTSYPGELYLSPDEGVEWWERAGVAPTGAGLEALCGDITDLIESCNGDVLMAVDADIYACGGVFLSGDRGRHWVNISADVPAKDFASIVADCSDPPTYYAGEEAHGTYATTVKAYPFPAFGTPGVINPVLGSASGSSLGGDTVIINGPVTGGNYLCACPDGYTCIEGLEEKAHVVFGDLDATTTVCGSETLTVTTPPHPGGMVRVAVRNPDTRATVWSGWFTYVEEEGGGTPFDVTLSLVGDPKQVRLDWVNGPGTARHIYRSPKPDFSLQLLHVIASGSSGNWTDTNLPNPADDTYLYYYKVE